MALKRLNTEHLLAISWLSQPKRGGLTMEQVADEVGVSKRTLYNWLKEPLFERELKREMVRYQQRRLPEVLSNMYDVAIESDNAAMSKLVLQMNDMLTEKTEVASKDAGKDIDYDAIDDEIEAFGDGDGEA